MSSNDEFLKDEIVGLRSEMKDLTAEIHKTNQLMAEVFANTDAEVKRAHYRIDTAEKNTTAVSDTVKENKTSIDADIKEIKGVIDDYKEVWNNAKKDQDDRRSYWRNAKWIFIVCLFIMVVSSIVGGEIKLPFQGDKLTPASDTK